MVQQVTQGIKISVLTDFEGTFIKANKLHYCFKYSITIFNQSKDVVQLQSRYWKIKDALNVTETVTGEGVVGKKPVIKPGESYSYSSGCILLSPFGNMKGYYTMVNFSTSKRFNVKVPSFILSATFYLN